MNDRQQVEGEWVKCMRRGPGDMPKAIGWTFDHPVKGSGGDGGGYKWVPPGYKVATPDPAEFARWREAKAVSDQARAVKEQEDAARKLRLAGLTWGQANKPETGGGVDHPRLREYFETRKIDLTLTANRLPECLRYHPKAPDRWNPDHEEWEVSPAMLAKVVGPDGKLRGLHRTYFDESGPGKRPGGHGEARKKLGPCGGGAVRLCEDYASGVLIVGEGIETTYAAWASVYRRAAAWAALDAVSLESLELPEVLFGYGNPEKIHTIIVATDLDTSEVGQLAALHFAAKNTAKWPWVTIESRPPTAELYPDLVEKRGGKDWPREGKGVDWNDVIAKHGAALTARGILGKIDLEANKRRAVAWRPDNQLPSISKTLAVPGSPPPPPPPPRVAGEGNSFGPPILEESPLKRARRFLLECFSPPPGDERVRGGFLLRRWNDAWYEYDGRRWFELHPEHLRGRVWDWADGFYTAEGRDIAPLNPTKRTIDDILAALTTDTAVEGDSMPRWLPPSFDDAERPRWGLAAPGRRHQEGLAAPGQIIAFRNCLLESDKWASGELSIFHHHPTWFSASVLPFDLPYERVAAEINAGRGEELLRELCPTWLTFLAEVSGGSAAWIDCLQEWFGYSLVHSTRLEKLLILQGPTRSGKGTIERAWATILGEDNIVPTSFDKLSERFHMAAFVGKTLAVMSDAHVGKWTDTTAAIEKLKGISGGDAVLVERKHSPHMPTIRLTARFIIYCNEMPSLLDSSNALAGRLIVLPMKKSFLGQEDLTLKDRICSEAQGILIWALFGLRRLWENVGKGQGFTIPRESIEAVEEFARESSPAHSFGDDCLTLDAKGHERIAVVYAAWDKWCSINGRQPGSVETFSRKLRAAYPTVTTKQRVWSEETASAIVRGRTRVFEGLRLTSPPTGFERPSFNPPKPKAEEDQGDQGEGGSSTPPSPPTPPTTSPSSELLPV